MEVVVLGSGGWGTALALLLLGNGHHVTLWSPFEKEAALLREALDCVAAEELRDTVAAEERDAAEDLETLEEDAEPDVAELPLVLEDLVAELPELVPVALRLACAFNASGVRVIAIARSVTIRVLSKVFIRLIDIIFFGD